MLESTLSYLGKCLAERSGLGVDKVVFHEKDLIFSYLKDNNLPRELPLISYYLTDVTDPGETRVNNKVRGNYNYNFTTCEEATIIPVKLNISLALLSGSMPDYFKLTTFYFSLLKTPSFSFTVKSNELEGTSDLQITDLGSLSTPPRGEEGKDYDRGKYYVLEGSFSINSFMVYVTEQKVIRRISFDHNLASPINVL